jgi:hypothetical protein
MKRPDLITVIDQRKIWTIHRDFGYRENGGKETPKVVKRVHQVVSELIFICRFQAKEIKETKELEVVLCV